MQEFLPVNLPIKPTPKSQRTRKPLSAGDHWEERIAEARELANAGATDQEMANEMGISVQQMYVWRAANPAFHAACKLQKEMPDQRVQGVTFTMTQGFRYTEQQAIKVADADGNERVEIVEVERVMPPDKTLLIMWLRNRLGWRDQVDVRHSGEIEHTVTVDADPRRLAIALLATLRKGLEAGQAVPLTIEGETSDETA